jgi:peptide/nickel transport system substrate-binding protein
MLVSVIARRRPCEAEAIRDSCEAAGLFRRRAPRNDGQFLRPSHRSCRALTFALLAAALAPPASAQTPREELTIGVSQFPAAFHPNLESHVVQSLVLGFAHRPFTAYDADWKLVCLLCTELPDLARGTARPWTAPDGSPSIAATYRIRDGATWGDGTPVSTADVLFAYEIGRTPDAGANNQELYRRIERIEAVDRKSFTVFWNERRCDYQDIGDFQVVPAHLDRAQFQAGARDYRTRTLYETDTANPGLWFGPYRVTKVETGAFTILERNPTWWGRPGEFRRITLRTIENTAALEANLLSGAIDMIAGEDGMTLDQALAFERRAGERFNVLYTLGMTDEHIDLNLDNPLLKDVRVRQALLAAIDRQAMSVKLFGGKQPVAHSIVNPLDANYDPNVVRHSYDPTKAAALLDAAGYGRGPDGIRRGRGGERMTLEFMTTSGNRTRELVAQAVQSDLARVGIEVKIRNEPARVLFGETLRERAYSGMVMYANVTTPRYVPFEILHSSMIPTADNGWAGDNYPGYRNPAMDRALERVRGDCAPPAQRALMHEIQALHAAEVPSLPLYIRADPAILPRWLKGLRPTGHANPSTLWVEDWRVEEPARR